NVSVENRQRPTTTISSLGDVTVDDVRHVVTGVRFQPPLNLVQDHERGALPLKGQRRTRDTLDDPPGSGVDHRLVDVEPELLAHLRQRRSREQGERVPGLVLRHGCNLNPRRGPRPGLQLPVLEVRVNRPAKLRQRESRRQRVLAPTLEAAKHPLPVHELPGRINRVPPENEPELLIRRHERQTGSGTRRLGHVLEHKVHYLVADRPVGLRQPPTAPAPTAPGGPGYVRGGREQIILLHNPSSVLTSASADHPRSTAVIAGHRNSMNSASSIGPGRARETVFTGSPSLIRTVVGTARTSSAPARSGCSSTFTEVTGIPCLSANAVRTGSNRLQGVQVDE